MSAEEGSEQSIDELLSGVITKTAPRKAVSVDQTAAEAQTAPSARGFSVSPDSAVAKFPPPANKNTPLGHDGRLNEDEEAYLRSMGWDIQNYKQAIGPRQIELYLQGCLNDLIEFSEKKYKLLEVQRKQYAKMTKQEAEAEIVKKKPLNALKVLERWGTPIGEMTEAELRARTVGKKPKSK